MRPEPLRSLIGAAIRRLFIPRVKPPEELQVGDEVVAYQPDVFGPVLFRRARPGEIPDGRVTVIVHDEVQINGEPRVRTRRTVQMKTNPLTE